MKQSWIFWHKYRRKPCAQWPSEDPLPFRAGIITVLLRTLTNLMNANSLHSALP